MRLKKDYVLRQLADVWAVLPISSEMLNFDGMLTLNQSGVLLWNKLEEGADREAMADALFEEYEVTRERALADVDEFLARLIKAGCVEE